MSFGGIFSRFSAAVFLLFFSVVFAKAHAVPELGIGPFGPGTLDGSAPFNIFSACANTSDQAIAGEDCGESNGVVRTQDIVSHNWSITVDNFASGEDSLDNVVLEQTITPSANAEVLFESIPVACTPIGGGGDTPPSAIVNSGGISTLTCNLGEFTGNGQKSIAINVKISGNSQNGTHYNSTQRVYSLDADGNPNAVEGTSAQVGPILISAQPAFDLVNSITPTQSMITSRYIATRDVGNGPELGFYKYRLIRLAAARKTGIESIAQPLVFKDDISAKANTETGPDYDLEFYVTECRDNPSGWSGEVYGSKSYNPNYDGGSFRYHASDSGTCTYTRDNPADPTSTAFTVNISGADLSGTHYPTRSFGGADLSAGPYYAASYRIQIWVPFRSIDLADTVLDDKGYVYLTSTLSDFDPDGLSGVSNYGSDTEPGYNGALMNGLRGNNVIGGALELVVSGSFSKHNHRTVGNNGTTRTPFNQGEYVLSHSGTGELEPGETLASTIYFTNNGTKSLDNPMACDVFDNTTLRLTDRGNTGGTAGTYAYIGTSSTGGLSPADYTIEYANFDLSGDDPLDADGDGNRDYELSTGRYRGNWTQQRALRCDDGTPTAGWFTDPALVPGGIDGVNAVRVRLSAAAIAAGEQFDPAHYMRFIIPLQARDGFNGGPHDGEDIPVGTVLANFAGAKTDTWASGWTTRGYAASPENGDRDGDRVTLTRIKLALDKESVYPLAGPGETASILAGDHIVWKINSAVQSVLPNPSDATNLQIIDVLPPEATYNGTCTAEQTDATPPNLVEYNTDKDGNAAPGYTRLSWNFGDVTANTLIPPRIFCTDTDPLALHGTDVVNYAEMRADNVITALEVRSDTHTIKLEQTGEIQVSKKVDMPLDDMNDDQVYTLSWANFAASFSIDAPTIIDVLPFTSGGGDGAASLSPRAPASDFHGKLELTAAPTVTWLDNTVPGGGDPHAAMGIWYYSADAPETINFDPDVNATEGATNWCLEAAFNTGACPADFATVTALKFVSNYELEKDGNPRQGMKASFTLQAGDTVDPNSADANRAGDIYTNRFTFDTTSLPVEQFLRSNNVSVEVAAFSIGDLVFADVNGNGKYDAGVDGTVPDGVVVELYKVEGDGSEAKVRETTTGGVGPGRYLFEPLASGEYYIRIPATEFQPGGKLAGWDIAPPTGTGTEDGDQNEQVDQHGYTESTVNALGVRTGTMVLSANPPPPGGVPTGNEPTGDNVLPIIDPTGDDFSNLTLDIGLNSPLSSIGNMVWIDSNNNGLQDPSEVGLSNVTVNLLDSAGNQLQTMRTDNDGYYNFGSLAAGDYVVEVIKPAGYEFSPQDAGSDDTADSDVDTTSGRSGTITLPFGQHDTQWDAGLYPLGSIGDRVWIDSNNNGAQDAEETTGLANVTVILRAADGTEITRMDTGANGNYLFTDLPPATYIVDIDEADTDLAGYSLTSANDPETVDLAAGENYLEADFGYINFASVGDKVWHDLNGDGVQDAGEAGVPGVTVRLLDSTGGMIVDTTTTGANGEYLFTDVIPGDYVVEFVKPATFTDFVTPDTPDDALDSDATPGTGRTATFTLAAGQDRTDIDAGLYQSASLGNLLWLDENGDNLQTAGEAGLAGVAVELTGTLGDGTVLSPVTVLTDENGQYQFNDLYPGDYVVTFDDTGFVTADQGSDDALDSDVAANGAAAVTLASGDNNQTIDAGIAAASVTGRVWIDNSAENAIDDGTAAEQGVVGATVKLIDPATGNTVAMTTTGVDGVYSFTGVNPSNYLIEVMQPANMGFVTQDQGDDLSDSDVNPATGRTEPFTLNAGQHVTDLDAGIEPGSLGDRVALDLNNNGIQDAGEPGVEGIVVTLRDSGGNAVDTKTTDATGFYNFTGIVPGDYTVHFDVPANMSLAGANVGGDDTIDFDADAAGNVAVTVVSGVGNQTVDAGIVPATLGDTVWFDANGNGIQDATEAGVADILVTLVDSSGNDVLDAANNPLTTTTDAAGVYSFNVLPGTYGVKFTLPADMTFTGSDVNANANDTEDSDADPATGLTQTVALNSGDSDLTLDAGIAPALISGTVLTDANGNGTQEAGDTGVGSVTLTLAGTDVLGQPVTMTTTTDAAGNYQFNVMPGTYEITETNPVGTTSSGAEPGTVGSTVVNDDTITVTVKGGETSAENDFLDYEPAGLSGQVRDDQDGDADPATTTDPGIAGVEVILWKDTDGNGTPDVVYANATTNAAGEYSFLDIPPGSYVVIETDPESYASTADTDGVNNNRIAVLLASGETSPDHDFLDTRPANISGQVRDDDNRNADPNDTEPGIAGVTLTLYTDPNGDGNPDDGTVVTTTVTNAQGNYQFNNVLPGNYVVVETDPADYESTADVSGANDNQVPVSLLSGTDNTDNDFLDTSILGSLSGVVWSDTNPDGTQGAGENGIPNATVLVKDEQGVVVATLTTDGNGAYQANGLPAGNYTVAVVPTSLPAGSIQTGDPDTNLDHAAAAVVVSGENTAELDFGYVVAAGLGDKVWEDLNANGIQDAGEPAIAGVAVELLSGGNSVATTTTDANGLYRFDNLIPGDYTVVFTTPNDFHITDATVGADDTIDSNIDGNGQATVTLASADNLTIDAGFYRYGELGNKVWLDLNNNGLQDAGESAVSDVTVNLLDAAGNPVLAEGVPVTTTTDASGNYRFSDLKPGDYQVEFVAPNGISFVAADQGADDSVDSDARANGQAAATVVSNQFNQTVDAGIVPAAVSGRVWIDNNTSNAVDDGTAAENGVVGVTVNLIDNETGLVVATTTTGADGEYNFTTVLPGDYVVEVIEPVNMELVDQDQGSDDSVDSDFNPQTGRTGVFTLTSGNTETSVDAGILPGALGDHVFLDENENGLQDGGEPGVEGVTVNLINSAGEVLETQVTDETGFYDFTAELPGEYTVEFVLPNGMVFTTQNVGGDDTIDSDVNPADGRVQVTVVSDVANQTVDAGIIPAKIGDTVWLDLDGDGTQGGQEPTVANVEVTLLDAAGEPALDKGGMVIKTTTDTQGNYQFIVEPGTYGVQFTLPENTAFTTLDAGSNDASDSDADLTTGKTGAVTVASGEHNTTLDAGIKPATISGTVLQDNDGDAAESGADTPLSGVTVTLTGTDVFGNPLEVTAITDELGEYSFDVPPGSYTLTETNPEDYVSSAAEPGTVGSTVVNTDIVEVVVASDEHSEDNDFLDYQPASLSGQVREDMNGDADTADATDPAIASVAVILWRDTDGNGTPDEVFANTATDASGNYSFNDLPPGNYVVIETDSATYQSTADTSGNNDNQIPVLLASGEHSPDHDFLDTRPTTISGQVREDEDRDGNLTDADEGLEGVTVVLYTDPNGDGNPEDGQPVQTTTTNPDGNYVFNNVVPGDYVIVETDPEHYTSTGDTVGEPIDNQIPVQNVSGQDNTGNDLLDTKLLGSVTGAVWDDENADGVQDPGEAVFPGVTVTLIDGGGNETVVQTNQQGVYTFPDLIPAEYTVVVDPSDLPENTQQTGDPDATNDHQHTLTVQPQTDVTDIDFGYVVRGSIGDTVWHDLNANGIQDAGEPGIADVQIQLLDANQEVLATTTTDADGRYAFEQLLPGEYRISVEMPVDYDRFSQVGAGSDNALDSDVEQDGQTTTLTLAKGQNRTDIDAGLYAYASVGNIVWLDRNNDDLQQDGEPGVQNITVTLSGTNAEGVAVNESAQTDVNGAYSFTDLVPGEYTLDFDISQPVTQDANGNAADTIDSDVDANGRVTTTLTSGEDDDTIDAGVEKGRISDTVWEDLNGNGQQDDGEPGIPGVVVTLYTDPNGDGNPDDGEVLTTTATDQNGNYLFDGLLPDDYVVVFTTPDEHLITDQNSGQDDAVDSDINPQGQVPVTINAGDDADVDAGFYQLGSVGNRVWLDENNDGYQDAGEASVSDVTVALYDLNGQPVNDISGNPYLMQTDAEGNYRFDDLEPGEYQVRFTVPAGITYTQTDRGDNDAIDSDANANGHAVAIVTSGQHNDTVDAGLIPAAVTGRVWIDNNQQNGVDDGLDDEPGMIGIVVNLLDEDGNIVYTTTTGEDGTYTFTAVLPDDYQVEFIEPENIRFVEPNQGDNDALDSEADVTTGRTPFFTVESGGTVTDVDAGIEPGALGDRVWLDANENGIQDEGESGVPGIAVHLLDGQSLTIASTTTDENGFYSFTDVVPGDYTVKFERPAEMQFIAPNQGDDMLDSDVDVNGAVAVTVSSGISGDQSIDAGIQPAFIGDRVWLDADVNDVQSGADRGLANITVQLKDKQGNVVDTTTTDADGLYQFAVIPGEYQVNFVAPNSVFSNPNVVNDDSVDSDADASGLTHIVDVESGESDLTLDAGILPALIAGQVLDDANGNGQSDDSDTPQPGTTVTLTGTDVYGNPVTQTVVTDENGEYQFIVPPGDYTLTATNPDGTTPNGVSSDDPDAVLGNNSINLSVSGTEVVGNNDFLNYTPVTISGTVQDDQDGQPGTTSGNKPLSGVEVALYTDPDGDGDPADGVQVTTTITDGNGGFLFENQKPGNYVLIEYDPAGTVSVADVTGTGGVDTGYPDGVGTDPNNNQIPLTVVSGTDSVDNVFLDAQPVTIAGVVRDDDDFDGVYSTDDAPLSGVTVTLYTDPDGDGDPADGVAVQAVVTDAQGGFSFDPVAPGHYVVAETDPANYSSVTDGVLPGSSANDNRIPLTLTSGDTEDGLFFLDVRPQGTISGQVQNDADGDGDLNDPDAGVAGVVVELWSDPDGDGNPEDGVVVASVVTDGQGNYSFTDVNAGSYVIVSTDGAGYTSTGDASQTNDNQIPVSILIDQCTDVNGQAISCTGLDFLDSESVTAVTITKTVYSGHDQGGRCGTAAAKPEVTLVDIDKSLTEQVTYCFEVTNTGENYLADIQVTDQTLQLTTADLTLLGSDVSVLPPVSQSADAKLVYYYEHVVSGSLENTASVTAQPVLADGTPVDGFAGDEDQSVAIVNLVVDPPSGIKTVSRTGDIDMQWQMVWINSMPAGGQAEVVIYDEVPVDTRFTAMAAGQFVSPDGVYCEARGQSVTNTCTYEGPGADYPRGRVLWTGSIHGDGTAGSESEAANEVVIRFVSTLTKATPQQVIQNRAHSSWDTDGDGNPEFADVVTTSPNSADPDAPTSIEFGFSSKEIPTMSWWMMMLMSLLMSMVVGWRYRGALR